MNPALVSSKRMDWETPESVFAPLHAEFEINLDVCATRANAKSSLFYSPESDGLKQTWAPMTCWMNPPYGTQIGKWIAKARSEADNGATVVCLIPSRTDTRWWHEHVMRGEIRFLKGRIQFVGAPHTAPFPCAIAVMRPTDPKRKS